MRALALALTLLLSACFTSERPIFYAQEGAFPFGDAAELTSTDEYGTTSIYRFTRSGDHYRVVQDTTTTEVVNVIPIGRLGPPTWPDDLVVQFRDGQAWRYVFLLRTNGVWRAVGDARDFQSRANFGPNCQGATTTCQFSQKVDLLRAYTYLFERASASQRSGFGQPLTIRRLQAPPQAQAQTQASPRTSHGGSDAARRAARANWTRDPELPVEDMSQVWPPAQRFFAEHWPAFQSVRTAPDLAAMTWSLGGAFPRDITYGAAHRCGVLLELSAQYVRADGTLGETPPQTMTGDRRREFIAGTNLMALTAIGFGLQFIDSATAPNEAETSFLLTNAGFETIFLPEYRANTLAASVAACRRQFGV